jgi:hypothetical protein
MSFLVLHHITLPKKTEEKEVDMISKHIKDMCENDGDYYQFSIEN